MDERRLTEMFSEAADSAAHNAPPATFDHSDVVAGSRRAQQRSRRLQTSAIAVAVIGLAAAGTVGIGVLNTSTSGSSTLAEPSPVTSPQAAESAPGAESAPQPFGAQSDSRAAAPFAAEKRAGSSSCAVPDRQLFEQLSEVVPAVRGATPRPLSDEAYCPEGARGVEVDVTDGGAHGVLRVLLSPPGSLGGGSNVQTGGGSQSTSSVATHDGGSLSLTTSSSRGDAPFEDDLDDLADKLAAKN
ncbi:hypothetical protein ACTXG6_07780 [Pseudonocardia sp. Cha107L01]|uniref:hypothetical protein n=1 Tax=Pseudonocardia sp. Cha107L01 TaxID=3457576 RepID=UPI00403EDADA